MALQPGTSKIFAGVSPVLGVLLPYEEGSRPLQAVLPAFRALAEEVSRFGSPAGSVGPLSVSASRDIFRSYREASEIKGDLSILSEAIVRGLHGVAREMAVLSDSTFVTAVSPLTVNVIPKGDGSRGLVDSIGTAELFSFFNGTFLESFDALVTSDGATVTMSLEQVGTGDLTMQFNDGQTTLDCTPAATIPLTAGADDGPTGNFIYILQSGKVLAKSTTDWPAAEHIKIGYFLVPSAAFVAANGVYVNHNTNDHAQGTDSQGHLVHITERLRSQHAIYKSGVVLTMTVGGGATVDAAVTAGVVYQMHKHTTPALNTASGDAVLVVNQNGAAYDDVTDLENLTNDSGGVAVKKYFNWVIWGVGNKGGEYAPLMLNLPTGSYNQQASAEGDISGYDVLTIPSEFNTDSQTGFLIARVTMSKIGGTWAHISTVDLRGATPQTAVGGVGGVTTEFADNAFKLFDESDNTKELDFQLSAITTGNRRTITASDADLDLGKMVATDAVIADHALVRGDGGGRGVQSSGWTLDDANLLLGGGDLQLIDNKKLYLGTGSDYWIEYTSGISFLRFRTTDGDGGGSDLTFMGVQDGTQIVQFPGGMKANTINEYTAAAGVTIEGVLLKDGLVDGIDVAAHIHAVEGTAILSAGPVTDGWVLTADGAGGAAWEAVGGGGAPHAILDGSTHSDSVADAVTRGSLIYGNSTPKWDELVIGAAATYLRSDGTDAAWTALAVVDDPSPTLAANLDCGGYWVENFPVLHGIREGSCGFLGTSYGTGSQYTGWRCEKYGGTIASPTAVVNGNTVGIFSFWAYDGTVLRSTAHLRVVVDGAVSSGVVPMAFSMRTGTTSGASERWRTGADGNTLVLSHNEWQFRAATQAIWSEAANNLSIKTGVSLDMFIGTDEFLHATATDVNLLIGGSDLVLLTENRVQFRNTGGNTYGDIYVGTASELQIRDLNGDPRIRLDTDGIAFNGFAPLPIPNVTGSRDSNAALSNLLTSLAFLGLVTDSTTRS